MPVGTINEAKERAQTYQPLLLAEFTLASGPVLRVASHPLNVTEGGFQYDGKDWLARVTNYDITATQALSDQGIDYTPSVTITLADAQKTLYTNYEQAVGFRGALVTLTFIFWNVGQNEFSTDRMTRFVGVCGKPAVEGDTLVIPAISLMNMSQAQLPPLRVQKRCLGVFPMTAAQRQEGADDESSQFWLCGYAPDVTGPNTCGNLNGSASFTSCGLTFADCMARLGNGTDIWRDGIGRLTGRFSGIQWQSPQSSWSRGYISSKWEEIVLSNNEAKYGDFVPLVYGTSWIDPLVLDTGGSDANFTKMEVLLGCGEFTSIHEVVVDGVRIPQWFGNLTEASKTGWWAPINWGKRNGKPCMDAGFDGKGDPFGNLCVLEVVAPRKLVDASSAPRIQVLAQGPALHQSRRIISVSVVAGVATVAFEGINNSIASNDPNFTFEISGCTLGGINKPWKHLTNWTYGPPGTVQFAAAGVPDGVGTGGVFRWKDYTDNLAWVLRDVLTWGNWRYSQMNEDAWMTYAAKCDTPINYKDMFGNLASHKRYTASLYLRQRRSVAEVVRGLRTAGRALLYLDQDGKLAVRAKETLASQQPNPVPGSNYNSLVASKRVDGAPANGYVAYRFDETNIALKSDMKTPTLSVPQKGVQDAPNRVSFPFQDRDNRYASDTLTIVDAEDVARIGQEVSGSVPIEGINNADQGRRAVGTWMAENNRGNPRLSALGELIGDTGGTDQWDFETTFKVIHLNIGDICMLNYAQYGIANQLVRVQKIQPGHNFGRVKLTVSHHNDNHYLDSFRQEDAPAFKPAFRNRELRPSYAWFPYQQQPLSGDSMYAATDWQFSIAQDYEAAADGTAIAKLRLTGKPPVNVFPAEPGPPFVGLQGSASSFGGSIPGGRTYYFVVCANAALRPAYKLSQHSKIMSVDVPAGTNTNTVTINIPQWMPGTQGYVVFGGRTPQQFCKQVEADGTPASITVTALEDGSWGVPDTEFDRLRLRVKHVRHSGVWGAQVVSCTHNSITVGVPAGGFALNEWAGYDLTWLGAMDSSDPLALANFRIASNTADTLTLAPGSPDPVALGMKTWDVLVMRSKPTVGQDAGGTYLEDPKWQNEFYPAGMAPGAEAGSIIRFVTGTGRGQTVVVKNNTATRLYADFPVPPDSTSRYIVEESEWLLSADTESLNNSDPTAVQSISVDVNNYRGKMLLAQVLTVDGGDTESNVALSPIRELYVYGAGERFAVAEDDYTMGLDDSNILVYTTDKPITVTLLPTSAVPGREIMVMKMTGDANAVTVVPAAGDTITDESSITLTEQWAYWKVKNAG